MARRRFLARLAVGLAGTHLGLRFGARETVAVGPARIRLTLRAGTRGGVELNLPPLGSVRLATHTVPVCLSATLTDVDPDRIGALGVDGSGPADPKALLVPLRSDATQAGRRFAVRAALAGLTGAAGLSALMQGRPRDVVAATAVSAGTLAAAAGAIAATWDRSALRDPQLTGLLTRAPLILGDMRSVPQRLGVYQQQLAELVNTASTVYRRVTDLPEPPPDDAIRLLHVSDIHLNPIAFHLAAALIEQYRIDAVIDTGDLVDWGTPMERTLTDLAGRLGVPYLFVKGNHDSDLIAAAMAAQPNAVVLDGSGEPVEVAGLRFVGVADPRFTPDKRTGDDVTPKERLRATGKALADAVRAAGSRPDIALAHDPAVARQLAGVVPLVLAGHTHRRSSRRLAGTLLLVQGSSGGAGLRGVQESPPTPLCFSVLYIDRATRQLHTVDDVTTGGLGHVEVALVRLPAAELVDGRR